MKKVLFFIVPLSILLFSMNVSAVLLDRRGGMIYDTDLNITWLKDANYAQTSGYDADGMMTWFSAKSWAENLVYGGYDDWRLPSAINQDGTGPYWAYRCEPHITGSELGHLYYVELGNSEPLTNTGPFLNMQNSSYWFGTEYVPTPELEAIRLWDSNTYGMPFIPATDVAWEFAFHNSEQLAHNSKSSALLYAWAVRDGDVDICITPPTNLISWWTGDGSTNDIVDGNHGTLQGGASFGAGLVGQAFSFDGVDDFVMVPDNPSLNFGTNDFTFDFWVKFNTTEGEQILIEKFVSSPPATGWTLTKLAGNVIRFANDNPAGWVGLIIDVTPPSIPTDTWIFVAVTRNGNTYKVYWDGVAIGETTLEANLNLDTTSSLKFGHRGNPIDTPGSIDTGGYYLHGLIDEVEIYNRALSPSEIESIYNAGSAGKCKSPDISVSPTSYDFGSVNVGTSSSPQTFTISNTGTADLIVSSIDLSDITNYTIDKTGCGILPATITPGNNCTVTVTFSPSSTGTKNATLTITSDDPDTLTLNVSLSGIGVQQCFSNLNCNSGYYCKKPEGSCYSTGFCSVRPDSCTFEYLPVCGCNGLTYSNECVAAQSGVSVAYQGECVVPPTIGYSPTTFSFTATQGGSNPPSQNLSITNTGGGTLNWSVSDDATWLNLSPLSGSDSGTVTLSVDIAGLTVGTYNGTITITAAGSTNTPVNIPVTLTVNAPPAATLTLLVPNGGDVLPSGGIYAICWQAPTNVVKFDLSYSIDNGENWVPIKSVPRLNCTHWEEVPVVSANKKQCRVK